MQLFIEAKAQENMSRLIQLKQSVPHIEMG